MSPSYHNRKIDMGIGLQVIIIIMATILVVFGIYSLLERSERVESRDAQASEKTQTNLKYHEMKDDHHWYMRGIQGDDSIIDDTNVTFQQVLDEICNLEHRQSYLHRTSSTKATKELTNGFKTVNQSLRPIRRYQDSMNCPNPAIREEVSKQYAKEKNSILSNLYIAVESWKKIVERQEAEKLKSMSIEQR